MGKMFWVIASLICAVAALHIGLLGFGYNVLHGTLIQMRLHQFIRPIDFVVGCAGLYLLISTLMCTFGKSCSCK